MWCSCQKDLHLLDRRKKRESLTAVSDWALCISQRAGSREGSLEKKSELERRALEKRSSLVVTMAIVGVKSS